MSQQLQVEPCELLAWDSEHFGLRVARVRARAPLDGAVAWAERERIDCLYLLVDAADSDAQRAAQRIGFRFVDVRITLAARPIAAHESSTAIRPGRAADLEDLLAIAHDFRDSRFYADGHFETDAVDRMFARWVTGSLDGSLADLVLVADGEERPAGFITARFDGTGRAATIELVGTAPKGRRRGTGRALVAAMLTEFAERDVETARVVTQARNIPGQRLYQACGFRTEAAQLWFHRWADEQPA